MELFEGNGFACSSATTDSSSQSSVAVPPVKKQDLSSLIVHTFLPRKIPDCLQEDLSSIQEWMLKYVHDAISAILATGVMPELESTRLMFEKWMLLQPKSVDGRAQFTEEFQESVRNLQIGDTISLYIRKQNSTIMITKTEEEKFQVMTFRSSLSCETVMSTVGSLVMDFPETKDVILNADILASKMFASHLHELSTEVFELSMPQTKKGGHDYSELREVADPLLVSDWIVGLLLPTSSEETEHDKFKITKKIRDEVNLETSSFAIPFRRSGMWMAVKVALQLQIENLMGDTQLAKMVYKSIVLWTLASICDGHLNEEIDMSSQMLAKIGRRVKKLQDLELELVKEHLMSIEESLEIHHACLEFVASVVDNVSKHMNTVWMEMSSPDVNRMVTSTFIPPIELSEDEIDNGLQHHIPLLDNYVSRLGTADRWINDTVKKVFLQNPTEDMAKSLNLKRYTTLQDILTSEVNFSRSTAHQKRIWFYDTESFIKNHLHDCSSESILKLIFVYVRRASPAYTNGTNPVGFSQMLLCVLKSVQVLDEIATNAYPLLKKYKSGINSVEFDKLLLPHKKDMKLLDELLDYFKSRDLEARWPSIISEREVELQTFAVLYAKSNKEMQQLRSRILTDIKKGIAEKYEEVDRVRTDCQILQSRIIAVGACKCECEIEIYGGPTKTLTCTSCNLTSLLQYKRHSVAVYERPLPPSEICQQAVVFELKLPSKLAELRDASAFLNFEILSLPPFDGPSDCLLNWIDYSSVRNYEPTCKPGQVVNLCSDELPASQTHHTRIYIPDVLNNVNSEFIVDNGMNYIYDNESKGYATGNVKKSCTFQISSTCNPSWKMFKYLQYTITDTLHCQNRVIADSNNCHRDMTIAEFISFGSIRAGHRIQLRNLYRSISDRTLALEREATTCLVLQTLWQVGPTDEEGNTRESHLDFTNNDLFSQSFLELLEQVVDLNETNYSHPLILLNVVVITIRIMELNESCIQNGVKLLRQCRKAVDDWVQRIGENMVKQCDGSSRGEVHLLKKNLLEATVCSAFSFNMSTMAHLNCVIQSQDDLVHWYSTLSRLNELTELETLFSSSFSKTLVKYAFDVALKIEAGIATSHLLHDFARTQWNKANECSLLEESWDCVKEHENLFIGEYVEAQTKRIHSI